MARPRKMDTEQMIQLVDSYFFFEVEGNPDKLKCSKIAEYASRKGMEVAAYDIRRNETVRVHMEELLAGSDKTLISASSISYRTLDVAEFMRKNHTSEQMRRALSELDIYWKGIAGMASRFSKENQKLRGEVKRSQTQVEEIELFEVRMKAERKEKNRLEKENRYLRRMLKEYLYPALANEILKEDKVLVQVDTKVTEHARQKMIEGKFPDSFCKVVEIDRKLMSEEEKLLERMWSGIET